MENVHPVIVELLDRYPLRELSQFDPNHDWLEFSFLEDRSSYTIETFSADQLAIQMQHVANAMLACCAEFDGFDVLFFNMKTGACFRPEVREAMLSKPQKLPW